LPFVLLPFTLPASEASRREFFNSFVCEAAKNEKMQKKITAKQPLSFRPLSFFAAILGAWSESARVFLSFGMAALRAAMPKVARVAEARVAGRFVEQ
jgi:hypothetical protein